ncbi:Alpha/Beta hydrolase protein [Xylariales sp. AK1849]|nr:Alpha/Beta hydrolase protein [Xylariales sp. AK1849]
MASEKPIITLVHGAWHPPHYYRKLIEPLREHGYIVLAPPMPTTGLDDSVVGKTYIDDVKRIYESLLPCFDAAKEAIIVCHSQGGIAGSAETEGQTVGERRAKGLQGGIKAIVYVAAFALPEKGTSLISVVGGQTPDWYDPDGPFYKVNKRAAMSCYGMLPETERVAALDGLVYQSKASQHAPAHFVAADVKCPKFYIACKEDGAIPFAAQMAWSQFTGCNVIEIDSDHSPFLREATNKQVLDIIIDIAAK